MNEHLQFVNDRFGVWKIQSSQVEADLNRRQFSKTWWSCLFLLGFPLQIKGVFFLFSPYWRDETPFCPCSW